MSENNRNECERQYYLLLGEASSEYYEKVKDMNLNDENFIMQRGVYMENTYTNDRTQLNKTIFCPQCGTVNNNGVRFCMKCGYNFETGVRGNVQPIQKNNKSTGKKVAMGCGIPVLVIFLLFVGLFILALMLPENEPIEDINQTSSTTESTTQDPIIYVTVEEMVTEFEANQVAAEKKYKGQTIAVTGIVDNVGIDILDNTYISLVTSEYDFYGVQCYVKNSEIDAVSTLQPGDKITVIGKYDDFILNVVMKKCEIKRD